MDYFILSLYIIIGLVIILGYIYNSVKIGSGLWNGINNKILKTIYVIMISLSFIFGLYLVYFFTTNEYINKPLLYSGILILLLFSCIWAWFPFVQSKLVLLCVSIGALLLLIEVILEVINNKDAYNITALIACIILFIQTFFFDFIIWNGIITF